MASDDVLRSRKAPLIDPFLRPHDCLFHVLHSDLRHGCEPVGRQPPSERENRPCLILAWEKPPGNLKQCRWKGDGSPSEVIGSNRDHREASETEGSRRRRTSLKDAPRGAAVSVPACPDTRCACVITLPAGRHTARTRLPGRVAFSCVHLDLQSGHDLAGLIALDLGCGLAPRHCNDFDLHRPGRCGRRCRLVAGPCALLLHHRPRS